MKGEERFHGSIKIYLRTKQGVEHTDALTAAILLPNDYTTLCDWLPQYLAVACVDVLMTVDGEEMIEWGLTLMNKIVGHQVWLSVILVPFIHNCYSGQFNVACKLTVVVSIVIIIKQTLFFQCYRMQSGCHCAEMLRETDLFLEPEDQGFSS